MTTTLNNTVLGAVTEVVGNCAKVPFAGNVYTYKTGNSFLDFCKVNDLSAAQGAETFGAVRQLAYDAFASAKAIRILGVRHSAKFNSKDMTFELIQSTRAVLDERPSLELIDKAIQNSITRSAKLVARMESASENYR